MKKVVFVGLLLVVGPVVCGQNLVSNCDFSLCKVCPSDPGQFDRALHWRTPGAGTSDLCHECGGVKVGMPGNLWGFEQAYSGDGYAHIISYYALQGNDYREYIQTRLACSLRAGETYEVSFRVSCSDKSRWAIDGMGLLFTDEPISQSGDDVIDPGSPGHVCNSPGAVITVREGWQEISGYYTAAGGEEYITIGNFIPEEELMLLPFEGSTTTYTSFYIDMVSVTPLVPWQLLGNDTTVCFGSQVLLEASGHCTAVYTWDDGSHGAFRIAGQPGTYSLTAELGCSVISDQVTVKWFPEPVTDLPGDTVICHGASLELIPGVFPEYLWQDGSTAPSLVADGPGEYWVTVTDYTGCDLTDTVQVQWLDPPAVELGDDRVLCLGDTLLLDGGNEGRYTSYLWQDGSTERVFAVRQDNDCRVTVSNPCGSATDAVLISYENCEPVVLVPNAFTPDGDGRNDTFRPWVNNINSYRMQVFDRWGALIFESDDPSNGWDGTKQGMSCPGEAYIWIIRFQTDDRQDEMMKGSVLLLK